jgi:chromate reductase
MTESVLRIAGIAGSLRQKSYNCGHCGAASPSRRPCVQIEIADISALPLYNEDLRAAGEPAAVTHLKDECVAPTPC